MARVDVGEAIGASFGNLTAWRRAWGVLALNVAVAAGLATLPAIWTDWSATSALSFVATALVGAAASGALFRLGLADRHPGEPAFAPGRAGLRWGALETRVLVANLIAGALFTALLAAVALICAAVFWTTGQAANPDWAKDLESTSDIWEKIFALGYLFVGPAGLVLAGLLVVSLVVLFWLGVRLMLYSLSAADSGSFSLARAWRLSRDAVAPLWLAWIVIALAEDVAAGVLNSAGAAAIGAIAAAAVAQALIAAVNAPLFAGLQLYVYRRQSAPSAAP